MDRRGRVQHRATRAADAGIEGRVSGHSLRVGVAQSLAAAGASVSPSPGGSAGGGGCILNPSPRTPHAPATAPAPHASTPSSEGATSGTDASTRAGRAASPRPRRHGPTTRRTPVGLDAAPPRPPPDLHHGRGLRGSRARVDARPDRVSVHAQLVYRAATSRLPTDSSPLSVGRERPAAPCASPLAGKKRKRKQEVGVESPGGTVAGGCGRALARLPQLSAKTVVND